MATTGGSNAFGGDVGEQRFSAMFDEHKRHLAYVGVALLLLGLGAWFYIRSNSLKEQHAEQAYEAATQSLASGNLPLAQSDLKKVAVRYAGTAGGTQGAMTLAKVYFQEGKYQQAVDALKDPAARDGDLQYGARVLLGDAYQSMGNGNAAARAYQDAAQVARFDLDKAAAMAMAARAYQQSNNKPAAVKIWTDLLKNPRSGFDAEAQIRLGELQAQTVKV
ncbi:MAG: tetratricopeptide repeat protein [Gemmatimonadaceae bacterium]